MKKNLDIVLFIILSLSFIPSASWADDACPDVGSKMDEIVKEQKQILDSLEQLKSELNIVKIRVSSS